MYVLMGLIFVVLLWSAYVDREKRPVTLLKLIVCALIAAVLFTKFHSPQYIVWFTPLLCLLVADNLYKIVVFYLFQIFAYIEFPLMFGPFYTNLEYANPAGSVAWYCTLFFFTAEFAVLILLVFFIIRPEGGIVTAAKRFFKGQKTNE
jgi:hypothetical protein